MLKLLDRAVLNCLKARDRHARTAGGVNLRKRRSMVRARQPGWLYIVLLICSLFVLGVRPEPAKALTVVFQVTGVQATRGSVRVDVCTQATFLKATCPYSGSAPAIMGTTTVLVEGVPPGHFAAQVYHDLNDNHVVDMGPFGLPREDIGFSGNPALGLHGPSFRSAEFAHPNEDDVVKIRLHHFGWPVGRFASTASSALDDR